MTTAAGDSSDSDDHELPEKEPEFIIHIVDDHNPPAAPRPMYMSLAAALPSGLPPVAELDRGDDDDDGRKDCTCCLFIKFVHFGLVMSMVLLTVSLAAHLPKEYRTGGDRVLILVGPIVIGVVAFSWLVHAFFDKERS